MAIVAHHCNGIVLFWLGPLEKAPLGAGVGFFFVLSGFILAHVYFGSIETIGKLRFYAYRLARVWPAYFSSLILFLVLIQSSEWVEGGVDTMLVTVSNVFMVQSLIPAKGYYFAFNGVSWSISTEIFFYLAFPFAIYVIKKSQTLAAIGFVAISFFGLAAVYTLDKAGAQYFPADASELSSLGVAYISPIGRIQEFLVGIMAFVLTRGLKFEFLQRWRWATAVEVCAVPAFFILLPIIYYTSRTFGNGFGKATGDYLSHYMSAYLFAAIIILFSKSHGAVSRLLSTRPMILLGEISFSMYLTHQILVRYYMAHRDRFSFISDDYKFYAFMAVTLLLSYLMWRFIETPAQTAIRKLFDRAYGVSPRAMTAGASS